MKLTVLTENTASDSRFGAEHGLSLYIETAHHKILFDMGQSDLFAQNAATLGIDLSQVDLAILSHGHYDHGGGLKTFLSLNTTAPIYLNRFAFEPHYHGPEKYIGLDPSLVNCDRLIFTDDDTVLDDTLSLHSCNTANRRHPLGSFGLTVLQDGTFLPDDFRHEQYLLLRENGKTILFSGCSHKGILDITEWFQPDILIGGFHFSKLPTDRTLTGYAEFLDSFPTEFYTCHCTGQEQFAHMKQTMHRLHSLSAGQRLTLAE